MTTPLSEWECFHCGQRCGGRSPRGYAALTSLSEPLHATCSPDDPSLYPDCHRRITEFGEPAGALAGVDPLPVGVEDIRTSVTG
jgi:hypothetical protein